MNLFNKEDERMAKDEFRTNASALCECITSGEDIKIICAECRVKEENQQKNDKINPSHYKSHPSGVECIQITEHMGFCLGNAIKYIWRAGKKDSKTKIEDLRKAVWYLEREIRRFGGEADAMRDSADVI